MGYSLPEIALHCLLLGPTSESAQNTGRSSCIPFTVECLLFCFAVVPPPQRCQLRLLRRRLLVTAVPQVNQGHVLYALKILPADANFIS